MARKAMNEDEARAAALAVAERESKKVRKRPDSTVQAAPGDNSKFTMHNFMLFQLEPVDMNNAEQVMNRTVQYFDICTQNDMKPSVAGYALALGIDRTQLWRIVSGNAVKPPAVLNTLKRAYEMLNAQMEDYMQNGKIQPLAGIFLMRNNHGYSDKTEIEISTKQDTESSPEELDAKYADAIPADYTVNDDAES